MWMIPITDPKSQLEPIMDDIVREVEHVLRSGRYILGPYVKRLEEKMAERLQVTDVIAVGNGTDALVLTLDAFGIGPGDEVITTPFTFFATAEAISRVGATPVFVDVEQTTGNIHPSNIEEAITSATKAILPVHLFGLPANMDAIQKIADDYELFVIEDACQAFGATYKGKEVGGLGDAACFSFFPTKNLSTVGDGGMIATSNPEVAEKIRSLRAHGSVQKYYHEAIGYNSRLDELHAAILLECLQYIDEWNQRRMDAAHRYMKQLEDVPWIGLPETTGEAEHVYHLFCIQSKDRTELMRRLEKDGIQTGVYYPCCLHEQKAYAHLGHKRGDFPVAESLSESMLAIPLYPMLSKEDQDYVIETIQKYEEDTQWFA